MSSVAKNSSIAVQNYDGIRVLSFSDDYLVIDKPSQLRMNTVPGAESDIGSTSPTSVENFASKWLENNDSLFSNKLTAKKSVKWVHQLDYATSGVLCIALNRYN